MERVGTICKREFDVVLAFSGLCLRDILFSDLISLFALLTRKDLQLFIHFYIKSNLRQLIWTRDSKYL